MLMTQKPTPEEKKKAEEMIKLAEQQGCCFPTQQLKNIRKKVSEAIKIEEQEERERRLAANWDTIIRAGRERG